ncbi:MAG: trehalose 6-phosphate phosphatase [Clostridia bacterium]|nr:trehalose 6-phosphate phosphatase [Clostridia bacterium]
MSQILSKLSEGKPEQLAALVAKHEKLLIMTDYDGTLVPIKEKPELAIPSNKLLNILRCLIKKNIVIAIVSGRSIDDLKKLIPIQSKYLVGCHGTDIIYPNGEEYKTINTEKLDPILDFINDEAIKCIKDVKGFVLERKNAAIALHYRLVDSTLASKIVTRFITLVHPVVQRHNLEFIFGKKVVEVRPRGINKGNAVKHLIKLNPGYYPIYFGDDTTDEDAFNAIKGKGIGVLISLDNKTTNASYKLRDTRDVILFLRILLAQSLTNKNKLNKNPL